MDEGLLASVFPEIRCAAPLCTYTLLVRIKHPSGVPCWAPLRCYSVNVKLEAINGQPVPGTFKEAVPLLKKRPFTLEFSTLADAVESVLAPSKTFGVHAPVVAAAMKGGNVASSRVPYPLPPLLPFPFRSL